MTEYKCEHGHVWSPNSPEAVRMERDELRAEVERLRVALQRIISGGGSVAIPIWVGTIVREALGNAITAQRRDPRNESITPRSEEEQRVWDAMQKARQHTAHERKDWGS